MKKLIKTVLSYANLSKNESSIKLAVKNGEIDASDPSYTEQGLGCFIHYKVCISIDNKKYDIYYNEFYSGHMEPLIRTNGSIDAKINNSNIEKTIFDGKFHNLTKDEINLLKKFRELGLILVNYDTSGEIFKKQYRISHTICSITMDKLIQN